jgi:hypothetical protein
MMLIEHVDQVKDYNQDTKFKIHVFSSKAGVSQADLLKFKMGLKGVLYWKL